MINIIRLNSPKYPVALVKKEISEMFSKSLVKPTYLVAENNKKVAGFGGFIPSWTDNMIYEMFWISVFQNSKKKGVGKSIITEIIKEIKKMKKPQAEMILISTEIPKYYKRFGFKKISQKYYRDYILMGKKLT